MNSYGDPNSAHGRAQVPGSGDGYDYDSEWRHANQAARAADAGRASVGRASVTGQATVGRASVGRASVGAVNGDPGGVGRATVGRAAVPAAATGRATVRPVSPAAGTTGWTPNGPGGRGWPGEPGPNGRRGSSAKAKRYRRRNLLIGAFAVFIMLAGVGVVAGTWYYDDVPAPSEFDVPQATTIFYKDGTTPLAKLGEVNREIIPISKIPEHVRYAVVSAEDRKFYQHDGIDFAGIARAAWNNITGGDLQGASTITQQYARNAAEMNEITYGRKLREAVMANKLEQDKSKDEILEYYLNTIYFGRGAYGIEAAAKTFFNVPAEQLDVAQAAVLAAIIKQPEPKGNVPGFDPARDEAAAKARWNYVLDGMVEMGKLTREERDQLQYPAVNPYDPNNPQCAVGCGIDKPTGNVVNYVRQEMQQMGIDDWNEGGYQVTTTIDPTLQGILEKTIRRDDPNSLLHGQPENLMAAAVAIDPETGQVLAYYGGESGTGTDYAGLNLNTSRQECKTSQPPANCWYGGHPPGSSFKIYTLAAGLAEGVSMNTYWDTTKRRDGDFPISDAGRTPACGKSCTLRESTINSYNTPFYWLTKEIGADKVVDAARKAGIRYMWPDNGEMVDLTTIQSGAEVAPSKFSWQIGYGQYGVTVLDHANGVATLAARGVYRKAHFVLEVKQRDAQGQWKVINGEQVKPQEVFNQNQVDDITAVLKDLPQQRLAGGRQSARKTGTWELAGSKANAHAWMVGYTKQIAAAVWVGNKDKEQAIRYYPKGSKSLTDVFGANLPGDIWKRFMDEAHKALKLKAERFPPAKNTGDDNHPAANGVKPEPKPDPEDCLIPGLFCPGDGDGDRGRGGGGGGDGGGGGGGLLPSPPPPDRLGAHPMTEEWQDCPL